MIKLAHIKLLNLAILYEFVNWYNQLVIYSAGLAHTKITEKTTILKSLNLQNLCKIKVNN